jgi:hypothetical protein
MFIYDTTTLAFIQHAEQTLKEILKEKGILTHRSRFLINHFYYPIKVVVFDGQELGHFDHSFLQIALNRKLIYSAKDSVIRDILGHELAHYLTYIFYDLVQPHGREFQEVCRRFGFPEHLARATMNIDESNDSKVGDLESEKIIEKVKKLLSLAQSSNVHEAELATLKANDLLLRHNLSCLKEKADSLYMDRVLKRKRKDAKIMAIYGIMKHFMVHPVISQGKNTCALEVSGSLTNVKLAVYVANFLDREFDRLWDEARHHHGLSGLQAKNSFFYGIAEGHDAKMKLARQGYGESDQQALVQVEKKLKIDARIIYRRLAASRSGHQTDYEAKSVGHEKGLSLTIRPGVEGKTNNLYLPSR